MGGNVEIRGPGWATASGGGRLKKPQDARAKATGQASEPERKQEKVLAVTPSQPICVNLTRANIVYLSVESYENRCNNAPTISLL